LSCESAARIRKIDKTEQDVVRLVSKRHGGEGDASTKACSGFSSKVWLDRQCRCMSSKPEANYCWLRNDDLL
jgi:hypothetical protein